MSQSIAKMNLSSKTTEPTTLKITPGKRSLLLLIGMLLIIIFIVSLAVGSVNIPLDQIITVLMGGEAEKASWTNIVLKFRLPRAFTAVLAGAGLGVSGLMMQTFFRNPLADPFILGISSGASLGVAIVVLTAGTVGNVLLAGLGLRGDFLLAFAAAVGAGISMSLVLLVARKINSSMTLLILGLMFGYLTSAMVSLLLYFSIADRIQAYINWTLGSFNGVTWSQMQILAPLVVVGLIMALSLTKPLNALLLGEHYAKSMGLNINTTRTGIIISTAVMAGAITAFCGPIGFIGVAVPHLCRALLNTSDHRVMVPATILLGAIIALIASIIAEVPGSVTVLPLNAVTSLIGAPVIMWVIIRRSTNKGINI